MYNTAVNQETRQKIMNNYENHLKNLMDLEEGEHQLRKKKLQLSGGFLPMLLPLGASLLGSLFKGSGTQDALQEEGYTRDEGVVLPIRKKVGRPSKKIVGEGIISGLNIPLVSGLAGMFGLGKEKKHKMGKGIVAGVKPKSTKSSGWIQHVKDYAQKNGISYKQSLTDAKASYQKK
jgi:hypothetical protein